MAILETDQFDQRILQLVNQERSSNGLDPVRLSQYIDQASDLHSKNMAARDFFAHTDPQTGTNPSDRARAAGYDAGVSENIGAGYRTPEDVVQGWMTSDGHRRNILSDGHTHMGVGYQVSGDGTPYWTQKFGSGSNPGTYAADTDNAPAPPEPAPPEPPAPAPAPEPPAPPAPEPAPNEIEGTGENDTLLGANTNDLIKGFSGDDLIRGSAGRDIVVGANGDDTLFGGDGRDKAYAGAGDDVLYGGRGNDRLAGGEGNDNITGGSGRDTLIGVFASDDTPGVGEVDTLSGAQDGDMFILGDASNVYYAGDAAEDYALITDLDPTEGDMLQLKGEASDYSLGAASQGLPSGTAITYQGGSNDEIIAIVQGTSNFELDDSSVVQYV